MILPMRNSATMITQNKCTFMDVLQKMKQLPLHHNYIIIIITTLDGGVPYNVSVWPVNLAGPGNVSTDIFFTREMSKYTAYSNDNTSGVEARALLWMYVQPRIRCALTTP